MNRAAFNRKVHQLFTSYEKLINSKNEKRKNGNGIYDRYKYPIITRKHIPPHWEYDLNYKTNPNLLTRLGVNTTFNSGAIKLNGKYLMAVRIESYDLKSFFGIAESPNGIDRWRFWDYPIIMPAADEPETNVYDIRLTHHEDGWIYGLFCAERKDLSKPDDLSAAVAKTGIARTKNLLTWERLSDLQSSSSQQRNCVLHPEFVKGKYMIYTRPQSGFIDTGVNSGIGIGFTDKMEPSILKDETIIDPREYHTIKEVKNGLGPPPVKTNEGWLHLAHAVRKTAAGLRYTLYIFLTDLTNPWKIINKPSGFFLEPLDKERIGDVSNVVFSNGWITDNDGTIYIYYASSDTRMHVATSTIDKLLDYVKHTPEDKRITSLCVAERNKLITNNLEILKKDFSDIKIH